MKRVFLNMRKTIVIDKAIAEQLDQFAKKKRITKSDLLEVALLDLFQRYKG
ncbi:ribbon-helix-helix domain-containing protein [Fictibacillus terranigra]|uniref:Ribbon-helix-helix domain-containing protein n=1 Tax=Fictibacillus terranigra TaxID=3058424 RepID=A0ABT8EC15_9BACL|nr:ribbon-helix-helix domain-containing protein [Fictibacillus sp. CENA-BCM004]MDN4075467.1 ribbon-helix-helix domain-containing protein [Fictibacillus sp. CENA-BCM004]